MQMDSGKLTQLQLVLDTNCKSHNRVRREKVVVHSGS